MSQPERFVVPIDQAGGADWAAAFALVKKISQNASLQNCDVVLLRHNKSNLDATSLAPQIDVQSRNELKAGRSVNIPGCGTLRQETLLTLPLSFSKAVVIAYYAEDKMLEKLDDYRGLYGVIAVPEREADISTWIERWNPGVLGKPATAPVKLISDPVVEAALRSLTDRINPSHKTLNERDKQHATEYLKILRAKGHSLDADRIKSWAIKNHWYLKASEDLHKIAKKISNLKGKPNLKGINDPEIRYQHWADEG